MINRVVKMTIPFTIGVILIMVCIFSAAEIHAASGGTYDLNEVGFINWMLDTKELSKFQKQDLNRALEVIQKAEDESFSKWYGGDNVHFSDERNDKVTDLSDINDALNLRHFAISIGILRDINKLRHEDNNFLKLNCQDGYTNFYFMAVAATGAMRGAGLRRHSLLQVSSENLCWHTMDPVAAWLGEKPNFNYVKVELGIHEITTKEQVNEIDEYALNHGMEVGHYATLFYDPDQVMGVGYTPYSNTFCYNVSESSNYRNDQYNRAQHLYTVDEFEDLMKEFCQYVGRHDFDDGEYIIAPTCLNGGTAKCTCLICGEQTVKDVPAKGHTWSEKYTIDKESTCAEEGVQSIHCTECGVIKEGSETPVPKKRHNFWFFETVIEPTVDHEGLMERVCEICGYVDQKVIPALSGGDSSDDNIDSGSDSSGDNTDSGSDNDSGKPSVPEKAEEKDSSVKPNDGKDSGESEEPGDSDQQGSTTVESVEEQMSKADSDGDLEGSSFGLLQAKGTSKSKGTIKVTWKKINGASKYIVYGNRCGKKNKYKELCITSKKTYTQKHLKKGKYYKYLVVAVNDDKVLSVSKTIHVATKGGKVGNPKSVKIKKKSITIKEGATAKIKAKVKKQSSKLKVKKHRKLAYETTDNNVASVSAKGLITAKSKGTCSIYVYAQNGVCRKVKVTVR